MAEENQNEHKEEKHSEQSPKRSIGIIIFVAALLIVIAYLFFAKKLF